MNDYALYVDPDTHNKLYRRFAPRNSESSVDFPDFKNFQFDGPEASNDLKFAVSTQHHLTVEHNIVVTYMIVLFEQIELVAEEILVLLLHKSCCITAGV